MRTLLVLCAAALALAGCATTQNSTVPPDNASSTTN